MSTTIRTPDQRVRVFISSTIQELAEECKAAREAIERLQLIPMFFEAGARPHPPRAVKFFTSGLAFGCAVGDRAVILSGFLGFSSLALTEGQVVRAVCMHSPVWRIATPRLNPAFSFLFLRQVFQA